MAASTRQETADDAHERRHSKSEHVDAAQAVHEVRALLNGDEAALLVVGAPGAGKTRFALDALLAAWDVNEPAERSGGAFGDAVMTVSDRKIADELSDEVIVRRGAVSTARPVTTLSAVAFRVLTGVCAQDQRPLPKLLNGAEQDAMLKTVVAVHVRHAQAGELCSTCMLLRSYFATSDWAGMVVADAAEPPARTVSQGVGSSDALFARGIDDAFVMQLRDMLARVDELGVDRDREASVIAALGEAEEHSVRTERLDVQWRLAFALREEYAQMVVQEYEGEFRLDASRLLVEGAQAVQHADAALLPGLLVVDDAQDMTLAGFSFLETLAASGVKLVLVGNPDEAVQTFRGAYPEYLFARAQQDPIGAKPLILDGLNRGTSSTYRDVVASRVSLSISSSEDESTPLPQRPGKLPRLEGSLPIAPVDEEAASAGASSSVGSALYRSAREEMDDVVWRIKRRHMDGGADSSWNSMVVIAHDNATVRAFGERLRQDGVPVRYSAVTKPLKDEAVVQGLFALLELADMRRAGTMRDLRRGARSVRARVETLLESPLMEGAGTQHADSTPSLPARLAPVESAMRALESLAQVLRSGDTKARDVDETGQEANAEHGEDINASLPRLITDWERIRESVTEHDEATSIHVDDSVVNGTVVDGTGVNETDEGMAFCTDAMYVMLALGQHEDEVLEAVHAVGAGNTHVGAFEHMWRVVGTVAHKLAALPENTPEYALGVAWDACGVAGRWQRIALGRRAAGRVANDRLDTVMRLFDYASGSGANQSVPDFIAAVRAMRIEADSLAKVAPVDQAVTLATPAGVAGRHWPHVWMVQMQQGVWPNLAPRNTLFGGEELANMVLHGSLSSAWQQQVTGRDPELLRVLASEQKSLLVSLSRASSDVSLSAVLNDEMVPSDFLYDYLPERFDRNRDADAKTRAYTTAASAGRFAGLDADPRGLVAAGRVELARNHTNLSALLTASAPAPAADCASVPVVPVATPVDAAATGTIAQQEPVGRAAAGTDAAYALALLSSRGVTAADPQSWAYLNRHAGSAAAGSKSAERQESSKTPVQLSPSQVDSIWGCPVCWLLENQFAGPRSSNPATSFGSIIHAVAEQASNEGLDAADFMEGSACELRVETVHERMMSMYLALRSDPSLIADPASRYQAMVKDDAAEQTLRNIATYFVMSNEPEYLGANGARFEAGKLNRARCEMPFAATLSLDDILPLYNSVPNVETLNRTELAAIMGALVGGWPEGMHEELSVRLAGSIDRVEWRSRPNGEQTVRVIDYKTGHKHSVRQMGNDLQLVCYQLGLAFQDPQHGVQADQGDGSATRVVLQAADSGNGETPHLAPGAESATIRVAQSMLFDVQESWAPAHSYSPEGAFQPSLLRDGHLNDSPFTPRDHYPKSSKLLDEPMLEDEPPQGVSVQAWRGFLNLRGTQAPWALTMIARVFYAAAAVRSSTIEARPQADHVQFCRMLTVCPACAGEVDTVFETRRAS